MYIKLKGTTTYILIKLVAVVRTPQARPAGPAHSDSQVILVKGTPQVNERRLIHTSPNVKCFTNKRATILLYPEYGQKDNIQFEKNLNARRFIFVKENDNILVRLVFASQCPADRTVFHLDQSSQRIKTQSSLVTLRQAHNLSRLKLIFEILYH